MKPGKLSYNLIGTDEDPIPENEPVFIIRGQDTLGEVMLGFYAVLCEVELNRPALARAVREHARLFAQWQPKKRPDL